MAISRQPERTTLFAFLRSELAPRPCRMRAVWRITAGCTLIVVLGMVFQIPLPAYMAYVVLLVSREESAATLVTGLAGAMAATLAVALSILFYMLGASEPGLRIPLLALSTFVAMFLARTCTLGPIMFLAGFVLVMSQTLIDDFPTLESLTRFVLWLWVVVTLPAFVTILIDFFWGENPVKLLRTRADNLLKQVAAVLEGQSDAEVEKLQDEAIDALALLEHATLWDRTLKAKTEADLGMFEGLITVLSLLRLLPGDTSPEVRRPLARAVEACRVALTEEKAPEMGQCEVPPHALAALQGDARPVVAALVRAVDQMLQGAIERTHRATPTAEAKRLFVPDAFTNRSYVRFALKTALAVTLSYLIYSMLDWPGIRTAITTCFFVALGSMAETLHKLSLRLAGAIVGGALAGFCIVYLLPQLTDIGHLSLLIAVVSAICAWVATSSERLAYAGMQMAFAFYLGVLDGYAPTTDLTGLRDRVVGILLGNILMSLIFSTLWPVGALQVVRSSIGATLDLLAKLISKPATVGHPVRLPVIQELVRSRRLSGLALFEHGFLAPRARVGASEHVTLGQVNRIASAVFVVLGQTVDQQETARLVDERDKISRWLSTAATQVRIGGTPPALDVSTSPDIAQEPAPETPIWREAMHCLRAEIADVAQAR